MPFSQFFQNYLFGLVAVALAALILLRGLRIMEKQVAEKGFGKFGLQGTALFVITPVIMVLAVNGVIKGEVVSGLLGALLGYIFGLKQET
mgnify:CR=1 FL=1